MSEKKYLDLLQELVNKAERDGFRTDRTGVGTCSLFGRQITFDLRTGFPMLTSKRIPWKSVYGELVWFLRGDTNVKWLQDNGITIWDEWADEQGELGPIYGEQWRRFQDPHTFLGAEADQIQGVIDNIKNDPHSRRHVVSAWNPLAIDKMALAPCHCLFQFFVEEGRLSCQLYQRSADIFLGVPFNIASYAALTHIIAHLTGLKVGNFVHTFGDVHLYSNHLNQAKEQLRRRHDLYPLPEFSVKRELRHIDDLDLDTCELIAYKSWGAIKAPVAV